MATESKCIFCSIADHSATSSVVFEDDLYMAFRDIHPEAPTHVLIMPKKHIAKLTDAAANDPVVEGLLRVVSLVAKKLGIDDACKIAINNGSAAGQIILHLHAHLLSQKST